MYSKINQEQEVSQLQLDEQDSYFSHANVEIHEIHQFSRYPHTHISTTGTLGAEHVSMDIDSTCETTSVGGTLSESSPQSTPTPKSLVSDFTSLSTYCSQVMPNVSTEEAKILLKEYDVANFLCDPSLFRNQQLVHPHAQSLTGNGPLRIFCNVCGQLLSEFKEIGSLFCLYCGENLQYIDNVPSFHEEVVTTKAPSLHGKKTSQITAALGDRRRTPFVEMSQVPFDCLQRERNLQGIRMRKPLTTEQSKAWMQKHGAPKECFPARNQITTHYTGITPDYLSQEQESNIVSQLTKNPNLIAKFRANCKKPLAQKLLMGKQAILSSSNLLTFVQEHCQQQQQQQQNENLSVAKEENEKSSDSKTLTRR